ncbi:sensor histidine kinase [Rhodohalobacter mucosus]|uniref:histidine kinase n=1 Tax=Rhodohalobacter mucosus TaxID=2079485 RepID=A0A316TUP2_9BACT|nr:HAMP domain-containing sensor histidine kinase [Rhodohalobacter mucosus]PWN08227.1 two-component sensor histidine kinase [Rhodohalobacter mucosus]
MSIRAKLAWTFILLLIFGITAISSYSILFIRNYLLEAGREQIINDSEWLAITIQNLQPGPGFDTNLNEAARTSGYRIAVYDEEGVLFAEVPYSAELQAAEVLSENILQMIADRESTYLPDSEGSERLETYRSLDADQNPAAYLKVSILKDRLYEPIKTIRWIIYSGMFISMGLVILVSILFSRYISRPILQLESAARDIAGGNVNRTLNLDRKDEFGDLAASLNRMAERFRSDNEEIKKLYEKQRQFFADITHEIRNPLHTIAGSLEMLQMQSLDPGKRDHYLQTAMRQTERINRLFKDLLTLQRYDSDSYFIEKKTFDLSEIIRHVVELYRDEARLKGLSLRYDEAPHTVHADPDKIEQVIENLVSNAVKYTAEGEIGIVVDEYEDSVSVAIRDTGIGISPEHLERLFDRFYRTDKARSRDKGGTGLGLAVVKSILNAHGTDIRVKSKPGEGSEFSFDLSRG